jgi:chloride channel 2
VTLPPSDPNSSQNSLSGGGAIGLKDIEEEMGYQQTLMYGRYSRSLAAAAKEEAKRLKMIEIQRRKESKRRIRELDGKKIHGRCYRSTAKVIVWIWKRTFAKIGEDWVFLAILGIVMAVISFSIDFGIEKCVSSRRVLYEQLGEHIAVKYLLWVSLPVLLILFATGFVHVLAPQAIGSGIPEMKTILRGVALKEYLTGRTLIAKIVGLTATLGSGMPLGKEGPFVHIACIVASLMSSLVTKFQGIYTNESRRNDMLAAAAAVGVACCFAAPVGGVLFSIEVTTVYFAVRNYWRAFFAAVCGAIFFRMIAIWTNRADTVVAMFRTAFKVEYPYDPLELFVFAGIGAVCGVAGWLYVYLHRRYVLWMRGNKRLTKFLQKNRFIYPTSVALLLASATFPPGLGMFHAGILGTHDQVEELFSNITWCDTSPNLPPEHHHIVENWTTPYTSIFTNLAIYIAYTFFGSILASTLPVPTGVVIPTFKTGAAFGRLIGEAVAFWFPLGISYGEFKHFIVPGGYATAGAAAFTGAVTHTISISVIVFEMTGQITHIIPVLIAVLVSNAIAHLLGPSCFDSIILIKKLPYLPDILPSSSAAYSIFVDNIMLRDVKFIWQKMSYYQLKEQLMASKQLRSFPLVDSPDQMVLLGSIQRSELIQAIQRQISNQKRLAATRWKYETQRRKIILERQREMLERKALEDELIAKEAERLELEEMARKRKKEKEEKEKEEKEKEEKKDEDSLLLAAFTSTERRPSRFEVTTVQSFAASKAAAAAAAKPPSEDVSIHFEEDDSAKQSSEGEESASAVSTPLAQVPKKSILKKNNSHTIGFSTLPAGRRLTDLEFEEGNDESMAYRTLTGFEHHPRWKNKLQTMFKKPSELNLLRGSGRSASQNSFKAGLFPLPMTDMNLDDVAQWEDEQMKQEVDFNSCKIDPAPFQLVEKTSLVKVHSLFSMVGLNMAYVTTIGRLVGVVGLKELRAGIENANGTKPSPPPVSPPTANVDEEKGGATREEKESLLKTTTNESPKSAVVDEMNKISSKED